MYNVQVICDYLIQLGQKEAAKALSERTLEQWVACENIEASRDFAKDAQDAFQWLNEAFVWENSPEKFEYWDGIADVIEVALTIHPCDGRKHELQ